MLWWNICAVAVSCVVQCCDCPLATAVVLGCLVPLDACPAVYRSRGKRTRSRFQWGQNLDRGATFVPTGASRFDGRDCPPRFLVVHLRFNRHPESRPPSPRVLTPPRPVSPVYLPSQCCAAVPDLHRVDIAVSAPRTATTPFPPTT